jgi:hypothetical protein
MVINFIYNFIYTLIFEACCTKTRSIGSPKRQRLHESSPLDLRMTQARVSHQQVNKLDAKLATSHAIYSLCLIFIAHSRTYFEDSGYITMTSTMHFDLPHRAFFRRQIANLCISCLRKRNRLHCLTKLKLHLEVLKEQRRNVDETE